MLYSGGVPLRRPLVEILLLQISFFKLRFEEKSGVVTQKTGNTKFANK
jgi:hypothetical protein